MKVFERDQYNLENGYTNEANNLDVEIRKLIEPIVKREIVEKGVSSEYFMYIAYDAIHMEILNQKIKHRKEIIEKNEKNKIKELSF